MRKFILLIAMLIAVGIVLVACGEKGNDSVEIRLPASMFEGQDIDEVIAGAKETGINEVIKNEDGSFTYKMSKATHNEVMKETETEILKFIEDTKNGEDYTSIKDITHNKSFSEFTLVVDQGAYENSLDGFAVFGFGILGMYYQLFDGATPDDLEVTIFIEDVDSGDVFGTVIYPDDIDK